MKQVRIEGAIITYFTKKAEQNRRNLQSQINFELEKIMQQDEKKDVGA